MRRTTLPSAVNVGEFLAGLPGEELLFHPNRGNAGDALIALATCQLFRRGGIPFRLVSNDQFESTGRLVLYGGGGNLVPLYTDAARFLQRHGASAKRLILLPHTVAGHEALLGSLGPNVTIFCRELVSYEHVRRHASHAEVLLAEDLALGLDLSAALHPTIAVMSDPSVSSRQVVKDWMFLARLEVGRGLWGNAQTLNAFRRDLERTEMSPPGPNYDLSRLGHGCRSEALAAYSSMRLLSAISLFDCVNTNRLHVCIAAALLGKTVNLYPNSYYKCKAVYDFSLARRCPTVAWHGGAG